MSITTWLNEQYPETDDDRENPATALAQVLGEAPVTPETLDDYANSESLKLLDRWSKGELTYGEYSDCVDILNIWHGQKQLGFAAEVLVPSHPIGNPRQ